jgi:hypothetical protein
MLAATLGLLGGLTDASGASTRAAYKIEGGSPKLAGERGRWRAPRAVEQTWQWVRSSDDNHGASFIIIDKVQARIYVFDPNGKLRGSAPVLLGLAKGDDTVPGIGDKPLSAIKPEERTTPAGRFLAESGVNAHGVDIVWVDYDAAISMHRVLTNNPEERRLQRLSTRTPRDNRISYGCINLPVSFYEKVVSPTVNAGDTVVYVLPETRPAGTVFGFDNRGRTTTARGGNAATVAKPGTIQLQQLDGA